MKQSLSVPEWHALAQEGICLPVCIPINGRSMLPLIRRNRDIVTVLPLEGTPAVGDIVLFSDPARHRFVLHRVWRVEDGRVLTWGDNCDRPDGWQPLDAVWGKAAQIERGPLRIRPSPGRGLLLARIWHVVGRVWRSCRRIRP